MIDPITTVPRRWWQLRRRRADGFVDYPWTTIQRGKDGYAWMVAGTGGLARPATAAEVEASCNEGY